MNNRLTEEEKAVLEKGYKWIDGNADLLIKLLKELVSRKSLSGEEGVHSDLDTTVGHLWNFLNKRCSEEDIVLDTQLIDPDKDYSEKKRENIYVTLKGKGDGGFIATSHTDVVPPGDPSKWPGKNPYSVKEGFAKRTGECEIEIEVEGETYKRQIRDKMDRIWEKRNIPETKILMGRGVYDNKASIVNLVGSILGLNHALKEENKKLKGDLIHGHLVDEETKNIGIKNMVGWGDSKDWLGENYSSYDDFTAVVLEGSYGFVPVVGFRGLMWVTLRSKGEASHASTPELGKNAVLGMSRALSFTDTDDFKRRIKEPFKKDELLGELTVASGTTIVGGDINKVNHETGKVDRGSYNAIPDWCEATFDIRFPRWKGFPEGMNKLRKSIEKIIENSASEQNEEITFKAEALKSDFFPPVALVENRETAMNNPLVKTASLSAEDIFGYKPGIEIAPGITDAALLYHGTHIPTLVEYGPAGALSHEPLEYVEKEQVIEGAKAMLNIAVRELGITD